MSKTTLIWKISQTAVHHTLWRSLQYHSLITLLLRFMSLTTEAVTLPVLHTDSCSEGARRWGNTANKCTKSRGCRNMILLHFYSCPPSANWLITSHVSCSPKAWHSLHQISAKIYIPSRCEQFATTAASCQESHEWRCRLQSKTNKSGKVPSSPVSVTT